MSRWKDKYFELRVDSLRDIQDLRHELSAKALELQALANDVHFEKLNNEQARLAADRERYLQKEVNEPWKQQMDTWREDTNRTLATTAGRTTITTVLLSAIISGVIFAVSRVFT